MRFVYDATFLSIFYYSATIKITLFVMFAVRCGMGRIKEAYGSTRDIETGDALTKLMGESFDIRRKVVGMGKKDGISSLAIKRDFPYLLTATGSFPGCIWPWLWLHCMISLLIVSLIVLKYSIFD